MARIAILSAGDRSPVPTMLAEFIEALLPEGRIEVLDPGRSDARDHDAVVVAGGGRRPVPSIHMHSHRVRHPRLTSLRPVPNGRRRVDILWSDASCRRAPGASGALPHPAEEELLASAFRWAAGSPRSRVIMSEAIGRDSSVRLPVARFERLALEHPGVRAERLRADAVLAAVRRASPGRWILLLPDGVDGEVGALMTSLLGGPELAVRGELTPGEPPVFAAVGHSHDGQPGPVGTVLAVGSLLEYLGEAEAAELVWSGVERAFDAGVVPMTLGGSSTMEEVLWWISQQVPILRRLPGRDSGT